MIYISSSCIKTDLIKDAVMVLAREGFRNIELSGGTKYYSNWADDLKELKREFDLNYLVHNYFPPPKKDFVLNLASMDENIYTKTLAHLEAGLKFTQVLGARQFSLHAGFYVDRPVCEIGRVFSHSSLYDREKTFDLFCKRFDFLSNKYNDIEIYIENNCYSSSNFSVYGRKIPFMLLDSEDYYELKAKTNCNLLLDLGHLIVSAKTLGLDFEKEFELLFEESNYIHLSDNDGFHDMNLGFSESSDLAKFLKKFNWCNKVTTLEVYEGIDKLKETYNAVLSIKEK